MRQLKTLKAGCTGLYKTLQKIARRPLDAPHGTFTAAANRSKRAHAYCVILSYSEYAGLNKVTGTSLI